jgi:LuxR family transcriptional regulator, maltose regulon positive regulatory protein
MNAKAIPASSAPGQADPPIDASATSQVAMVVMLVPIPTPTTGVSPARLEPTPPTYVDSHDHVWLLVDKASPMAAVFEQITAAESAAMPENTHQQAAHNHSAWLDTSRSELAHPDNATFVETLSRREIDVLRLMADGQSNQEIAQVLVVALNTVKMHVKHIYRKLGVKKRVQAVAQAQVLGLLATTMH